MLPIVSRPSRLVSVPLDRDAAGLESRQEVLGTDAGGVTGRADSFRWSCRLAERIRLRRRESNLTGFSETGLFLHCRRKSHPRNTRVPLNTRSIAPNQPQQDVEFSGRFAAPDPG